MSQFGCATACAGVTSAILSRGMQRNGPPEAVRMIASTLSALSKSKTWKMALCSESTGTIRAPNFLMSAIMISPAQTRHSLLARPMVAPRRIAAIVGSSPAAPTIEAMTQSAGRLAASTTADGPAATSMPVPSSASARSA